MAKRLTGWFMALDPGKKFDQREKPMAFLVFLIFFYGVSLEISLKSAGAYHTISKIWGTPGDPETSMSAARSIAA